MTKWDFKNKGKEAVLKTITEYLEKELGYLEKAETASASFDKPGWPYYQAKLLGEKNQIKKILQKL